MRLQAGIPLPAVEALDLDGAAFSLGDYAGRRLWLILSRFVSCPFCSLRLRRIIERGDSLAAVDVDVAVIFPSAERRVRQFAKKHQPNFRVLADPEQKVFEQLGSETSWAGELRTAANIPKVLKALVQTKMNPLAVDDAVNRMPSEYLVGPEGIIERVYYGEELDDGLAVDSVVSWARGDATA